MTDHALYFFVEISSLGSLPYTRLREVSETV